jgi:4'-phosphopantetheinyl transferase
LPGIFAATERMEQSRVVPIAFSVRFFDLDAVLVDEALLSAEERERVGRKATPVLRQRQAASFQCLRLTLGEVLGADPSSLCFRIEATGKPVLACGGLHFNVSHSGGVGLLAWGPRELGADVEALIARPSDSLAEEILALPELEAWRALPTTLRQAALTRAWTRKEATLKAIGSGLRIPPRTIEVGGFWHEPDAPGAPTTLRWTHEHEGRRWQGFEGFNGVPEGYRAAVCIEAGGG